MSTPLPVVPASGGYSGLIQRALDNTALAMYMQCPRKYYFGMVLNRRRGGPLPPALAYGQTWHKALEVHYKTDESTSPVSRRDMVLGAIESFWEEHNRPDDYRTMERCQREYDNYVTRWGPPEKEPARTVGWPEQPLVEIATEISWPGAAHPYAGKIDRIIQQDGLYYVEDHKTASQFGAGYFKQWELKNQMMGYAWMAQLITGKPIAGVRMNVHVCRKTNSEFERQIISFGQERLKHWASNYNIWVRRIEREHLTLSTPEEDRLVGDEAFPHNFDACDGKFGMCTYASVCSLPPRMRQRALEEDFVEEPWDPMHVGEDSDA